MSASQENNLPRCPWCLKTPLYIEYHDQEWGVPNHDEYKHFEFLVLESAQAGLSWLTILNKREGYRKAFAGFDFEQVARFNERYIEELIQNPAIVRNRQKIMAAVNNAKRFIEIRNEFGTFDDYIWGFVGKRPIVNTAQAGDVLPATTAESDLLSWDLRKRGFKFLGSTVMYAHMQAMGLVNDHIVTCFRYQGSSAPTIAEI